MPEAPLLHQRSSRLVLLLVGLGAILGATGCITALEDDLTCFKDGGLHDRPGGLEESTFCCDPSDPATATTTCQQFYASADLAHVAPLAQCNPGGFCELDCGDNCACLKQIDCARGQACRAFTGETMCQKLLSASEADDVRCSACVESCNLDDSGSAGCDALFERLEVAPGLRDQLFVCTAIDSANSSLGGFCNLKCADGGGCACLNDADCGSGQTCMFLDTRAACEEAGFTSTPQCTVCRPI